jgi:hypothetical protein
MEDTLINLLEALGGKAEGDWFEITDSEHDIDAVVDKTRWNRLQFTEEGLILTPPGLAGLKLCWCATFDFRCLKLV